MLNKLISLVFLLFFLIINKANSENEFILPKKKPSIFKEFEKYSNSKTSEKFTSKKTNFKKSIQNKTLIKKKCTEKKIKPKEKNKSKKLGFLFFHKKNHQPIKRHQKKQKNHQS